MRDLRKVVCSVLGLSLLVAPGTVAAETLNVGWKNGIRFESEDKNVKIKLGGRIMSDWTTYVSSSDELEEFLEEELRNGHEFRRARLYVAGELYGRFEWKAQYDFEGSDASFKDMYVGIKKIPVVGRLRIGHQKEPAGLEQLTSSKYITFIERSLPTEAFTPSRNTGFLVQNTALEDRLTWAAGIFRNADDAGNEQGEDDAWNYTGRVAFAPVYEEEGQNTIHLGASYTFTSRSDDSIRFRSRPEVHQSPRYVDTGSFESDLAGIAGAELAAVVGPFSTQFEFFNASVDSSEGDDPNFLGWYAMVSYFITGEHRPYELGKGTFGRVKPNNDFIAETPGSGAWELAARYSSVDLDDGAVSGGELQNVTLGLNWYMHPNSRIMLNYVYADLDNVDAINVLTTRFQVDF